MGSQVTMCRDCVSTENDSSYSLAVADTDWKQASTRDMYTVKAPLVKSHPGSTPQPRVLGPRRSARFNEDAMQNAGANQRARSLPSDLREGNGRRQRRQQDKWETGSQASHASRASTYSSASRMSLASNCPWRQEYELVFRVAVHKDSLEENLGVQIKHVAGCLRVMQIYPGGAVERINKRNKDRRYGKTVDPGDVLLRVNKLEGNGRDMIAALQSEQLLVLTLGRGAKAGVG